MLKCLNLICYNINVDQGLCCKDYNNGVCDQRVSAVIILLWVMTSSPSIGKNVFPTL